jgi:hypothetical protein
MCTVIRPLRLARNWSYLQSTVAIGVLACTFLTTACAGSASSTPQAGTLVGRHEEVILQPFIGGGGGGWCVTTLRRSAPGMCPSYRMPVFRGPIIIENWSGESSSTKVPVDEAVILTTGEVAAVSLEGSTPIATYAESALPNHMRAVVVDLRGGSGERVLGVEAPLPFPRTHFAALNPRGEVIQETHTPGPPFEFRLPSQSWKQPTRAPSRICSLKVEHLPNLKLVGGQTVIVVRPHIDIRGREFISCLHASYLLDGWPLEVDVLLDAEHPGLTPARPPAIQPLAKHPGIFQEPGTQGETLARRIPGAWLLVSKGEGLKQRLAVVKDLHVMLHLETKM